MTHSKVDHPDSLPPERLVARVKGDALHMVELVSEHGPDVLDRVMDHWGMAHCRRVLIALACGIDPECTAGDLWDWLGDDPMVLSRSLPDSQLWRMMSRHAA